MEGGSNFPEPKNAADRIALKAAELLDQDIWDWVSNHTLSINGVRFDIKNDFSIRIDGQDATILSKEDLSLPYRDLLRESYGSAMKRRREALVAPKEVDIANPDYHSMKRRREFWSVARPAVAVTLAAFLLISGIATRSYRDAQQTIADLNQVNTHGFRKGDIPTHQRNWDYPDDCFRDGNGYEWTQGLDRCRAQLEAWEKQGRVWVNWSDPLQ